MVCGAYLVHALTSPPPPLCYHFVSLCTLFSRLHHTGSRGWKLHACTRGVRARMKVRIRSQSAMFFRLRDDCPAAIALACAAASFSAAALALYWPWLQPPPAPPLPSFAASFLACAGTITSVSRVRWEDQGRAVPSDSTPDISTESIPSIPSESIPSSSFSRESRA